MGGNAFSIKRMSRNSAVGKILYIVGKEIFHFVKGMMHEKDHLRNVLYLMISVYSNSPNG
jgi:hypothetical protein